MGSPGFRIGKYLLGPTIAGGASVERTPNRVGVSLTHEFTDELLLPPKCAMGMNRCSLQKSVFEFFLDGQRLQRVAAHHANFERLRGECRKLVRKAHAVLAVLGGNEVVLALRLARPAVQQLAGRRRGEDIGSAAVARGERRTQGQVGPPVPVEVARGNRGSGSMIDAFAGDGVTYVICHSGVRSMTACEYVAQRGAEVANVAGGTLAWLQSGREYATGIT